MSESLRFHMVCRPITPEDEESYRTLVFKAGYGLVNIPKNPEKLQKNITFSYESLTKEVLFPKDEHYLFVLENSKGKQNIGGFCGIYAKTGVHQPIFFFRLEKERRVDEELKQDKDLTLLRLVTESHGPSELVSLYLDPSFRTMGVGRLLSLSRLLFIADNRERFSSEIVAEMRGVIDSNGQSPFWSAIGSKFSDLSCIETLNHLQHGRHFIPKILPYYPFYVDMLPEEAQNTIGKVHPNTEPALKMLFGEGFKKTTEIDVFDGGPKISAIINQLRLIEKSNVKTVNKIVDPQKLKKNTHIISNRGSIDFRCCLGDVSEKNGIIQIESTVAKNLHIDVGSSIRFGEIKPS